MLHIFQEDRDSMKETVLKLFSLLLVFSGVTVSEDQSGMFPV